MKNNFKAVLESRISANGNDVRQGAKDFSVLMIKEINRTDGKAIDPWKVSIKELAEALVEVQYDGNFDWNSSPTKIREALNTTHFPWITGELIHQVLIAAYDPWKLNVAPLVQEFNTNMTDFDHFAGIKATKIPGKVLQGQPYPDRSFDEKQCRVEMIKFGEIVPMTRELVLADKTNDIMNFAKDHGDKMGKILHRTVIQTIMGDTARTDYGESSATSLYYAGSAQTVFSDDHSAIDGQTNDNSMSGAINATNLESAYLLMQSMKDEAGDEILIVPRVVLCSPNIYPTAWKYFDTPHPMEPGSANLTPNFWKEGAGGKIMPISSPFITSSYWYLGDPQRQTRLYWGWRMETSSQGSDSDAAFERDVVARFKSSMKFGVALSDYRYLVRSTG